MNNIKCTSFRLKVRDLDNSERPPCFVSVIEPLIESGDIPNSSRAQQISFEAINEFGERVIILNPEFEIIAD
jgi:hypothetical protein